LYNKGLKLKASYKLLKHYKNDKSNRRYMYALFTTKVKTLRTLNKISCAETH